MSYTTLLGVDVPIELMTRLDEMARIQGTTRSDLVRGALAKFAGVEIKPGNGHTGNRDGQNEKALVIIKANPDMSIRALVNVLKDSGIKRGKTWVSDARIDLRCAAMSNK